MTAAIAIACLLAAFYLLLNYGAGEVSGDRMDR